MPDVGNVIPRGSDAPVWTLRALHSLGQDMHMAVREHLYVKKFSHGHLLMPVPAQSP